VILSIILKKCFSFAELGGACGCSELLAPDNTVWGSACFVVDGMMVREHVDQGSTYNLLPSLVRVVLLCSCRLAAVLLMESSIYRSLPAPHTCEAVAAAAAAAAATAQQQQQQRSCSNNAAAATAQQQHQFSVIALLLPAPRTCESLQVRGGNSNRSGGG
jgi:hypothetical protein